MLSGRRSALSAFGPVVCAAVLGPSVTGLEKLTELSHDSTGNSDQD
jgi:hypothetical protein